MREVKKIKSCEMFLVIKEILQAGGSAWITVTGMSMYPFLREDEDSVELSSTSIEKIKKGDIVLIQRLTGEYILHRVLKKEHNDFYIIGDAQQWVEGPLMPKQLVAIVTAVKRNNLIFSCQNKIWRIVVAIWINIVPLRHIFLKGIRLIAKIKKVVIHA